MTSMLNHHARREKINRVMAVFSFLMADASEKSHGWRKWNTYFAAALQLGYLTRTLINAIIRPTQAPHKRQRGKSQGFLSKPDVFFKHSLATKSALNKCRHAKWRDKLFQEQLGSHEVRFGTNQRPANSSQTDTNLLSCLNPLNFKCKPAGPSHTSSYVLARSPHLETVSRNIIQRGRCCPPVV